MPHRKRYNDTPPGAQPGCALALMLTLSDRSQQAVRFDGIEGDYAEAGAVVADIPHSFYLEEVLAADDPIRLAELDAVRATTT